MAGNLNSGNTLAFRMSDKELEKRIEQYKQDLAEGNFPRASWPHFCASLGYSEKEVEDVIKRGEEVKGAYNDRAVMLKRMLTWIRGQMLSGSGWSGQNQTKAIFALQQDHGDGIKYENNRNVKADLNGPTNVTIAFGGNDKRAKKAGK